MSADAENKRTDFFTFLILVVLCGFVLMEIESIGAILPGTLAGSVSGLIGVGVVGVVIAKRDIIQVHPLVWFIAIGSAIALYFLLRSLLFQINSVALPPYLPAEWIVVICQVVLGLLVGAGIPLLVYGVVVTGFRLLE
jgi:hypothetical protein